MTKTETPTPTPESDACFRSYHYTTDAKCVAVFHFSQEMERQRDQARRELAAYRLLHWLAAQDVILFGDFIFDPNDSNPRNIRFSLMMNDTFHYASADAEPFCLEQIPEVAKIYSEHGNIGLVAWASLQRGQDPLAELVDEKFLSVRKAIESTYLVK